MYALREEYMIEKAFDLSSEIWQWVWLFFVSFAGGVIGFITKISPTLKGRPFRAKIAALCMGMINSMFIAYISYEILLSIIDRQGLAVALSGMAAFTGTDLLIIMQNKIIELLKRKVDTI